MSKDHVRLELGIGKGAAEFRKGGGKEKALYVFQGPNEVRRGRREANEGSVFAELLLSQSAGLSALRVI